MAEPHRFTRREIVLGAAIVGLAACDATSTTRDAATTVPPTSASPRSAPPSTAAPTTTTTPASTEPTSSAGGPAEFVRNGSRTGDAVSLTFHASGDRALATRLLDLLRSEQVAVTVFGVGQWMAANPDLVKRIVDDGHEIGNHTYSHLTMGELARSQVATEIVRCADVLRQLTGSETPWFRPSGIEVPTATILAEAGKAGYARSIGYDVDSLDFEDPGASAIVANVRSQARPGSVVSLHFGHQGTIDALPAVITQLHGRGLRIVPVGQLLG